jgi:hypothetical protein
MKAPKFRFYLLVFTVVLSCTSFSAAANSESLVADNSSRVDFSGFWELDLGKSDNIQARLDTLVRELVERARRQADGRQDRGGGMTIGGAGSNSGASIIGLAKMADLITASQLLEIIQKNNDILIKREDNFALTCEFYNGVSQTQQTIFGTETCGWNSHQLQFRMYLPDGLSIQHILTLGSSGDRLRIATTVYSDQVSYPFTVNRVYNRYEPDRGGIRCEMTLTRGKVCTTEAR